MSYQLIQGDCLSVLPTLEAGSVHCCITSPPYFGLRDYGTGTWKGGSTGCDHLMKRTTNGHSDSPLVNPTGEAFKNKAGIPFPQLCRKCGARRVDQQLGLEPTAEEYVVRLVEVFRQVKRTLRDDGTLWLNLGDSYSSGGRESQEAASDHVGHRGMKNGNLIRPPSSKSIKSKQLLGIPWRVALALQDDGWILRSDIIWAKPNPMPESVRDRPTKAHEYLFLLAKSPAYYYDAEAVTEPSVCPESYRPRSPRNADKRLGNPLFRVKVGDHANGRTYPTRNRRSVWTIATRPYKGAHFATFPPALVEPCVLAGCPEGGTVLDPFAGAGTTGLVALQHGRRFVGVELNASYLEMARARLETALPLTAEAA